MLIIVLSRLKECATFLGTNKLIFCTAQCTSAHYAFVPLLVPLSAVT